MDTQPHPKLLVLRIHAQARERHMRVTCRRRTREAITFDTSATTASRTSKPRQRGRRAHHGVEDDHTTASSTHHGVEDEHTTAASTSCSIPRRRARSASYHGLHTTASKTSKPRRRRRAVAHHSVEDEPLHITASMTSCYTPRRRRRRARAAAYHGGDGDSEHELLHTTAELAADRKLEADR